MKAVYVGKNAPGSSMYLVAQQVEEFGKAKLATCMADMKGTDVINIVLEDTPKILAAKRFAGIGDITLFLAANWEEYTDWDKGAILAHTLGRPMVVHSKHSYNEVIKSARALLAPATLIRLMRNLHCIPYGVGLEFTPVKKDPLKWIVPYNRINNDQKNCKLHTEISKAFGVTHKGGVDHLMILHPSLTVAEAKDASVYNIVEQPKTREGYLNLIADRGAFLCTSNYESFGIYYLELLCSGTVGVFMDKSWIRLLLPHYPLVAKTKEEALVMMRDVVARHDYWYDTIVDSIIPYIRKEYDLKKFATHIVRIK